MALTPKERADFDEIVLRLRMEDATLGVIPSRRRSFLLMMGILVATFLFGLGVVLVGHGVLGPFLMTFALVVSVILSGWMWMRARMLRHWR